MIGGGRFAQEFVRYVQEVADVAWVADPDARSLQAIRGKVGSHVEFGPSYEELIEQGAADAVVVTTPNFLHAQPTIAAATAGLHVFCEKPMALTLEECRSMSRACEAHGVKLMVGHKRRLRPAWARMIELTRDDAPLGEPLSITVAAYADYRPYHHDNTWWADAMRSGGFLHVHMVHVVDWLAAMCGPPREVTAMYGPQHNPAYAYPDICHVTYRFESGAIAAITTGSLFPLHKYREAHGPWGECRNGGFIFRPALDHLDLYWQRLDDDHPRHERFDDLGFDHAFRREIGDFVEWIQHDRRPCLTWVEGMRCVAMMEAANLSAERGGAVVNVPTCESE
jgi:predicted dehydrogenase